MVQVAIIVCILLVLSDIRNPNPAANHVLKLTVAFCSRLS